MLSLEQRLDKVEGIIKKPSFRQNKGLGNEVGYYIFDYPAEQELTVREYVEYIRQKNEEAIDGFRIAVFDLYDILISILKDKGYLEKCFEFEKTKGFDRITTKELKGKDTTETEFECACCNRHIKALYCAGIAKIFCPYCGVDI